MCCVIIAAMTLPHRWLAAVPLLVSLACNRESPPPPAPAAAAPPPIPASRVFVTNEASGDLTVIDTAMQTVIATAPLGKRPRGIQASPDGRTLYVALSGSPSAPPGVDEKTLPPPDRGADGIGEIDADTYVLRRVIRAGNDPEQLDISPDGSRLYVANEDAALVSVVDVKTGAVVATVKVGEEPEGVTVRPDGKVVYVTSEEDGAVFAIDTSTNAVVKRIAVGHRPRSIGFLPDGSRAYVSLENDGAVALVDAQLHRFIRRIPLKGTGNTPQARPMGVAVARDGSVVYVSTGRFGHLFFVDPATNAAAGSIEVGVRPWGVTLLKSGATAYTANGPSNDVSVIDLAARSVTKKIPVGRSPWGVVAIER